MAHGAGDITGDIVICGDITANAVMWGWQNESRKKKLISQLEVVQIAVTTRFPRNV